ncbi:MAG: hypothetical protein WA459_23710 [Stellaceae bacterium]
MHTELAAPSFDNPSGVILICDQAITESVLIGTRPHQSDQPAIYLDLFSGILARSELDVIFHRRLRVRQQCPAAAAIERWRQQLPAEYEARFRVIDAAPLDALFGLVDLFVSFASPALVTGCRAGLKPVQIGRAVIRSEGFAHIFEGPDAFVDAIAAGGLRGRLSLEEYSEFERFGDAVLGGSAAQAMPGPSALSTNEAALARDPIVGEFRRAQRRRISVLQAIADVIANPVGAMRLLFGTVAGLLGGRS